MSLAVNAEAFTAPSALVLRGVFGYRGLAVWQAWTPEQRAEADELAERLILAPMRRVLERHAA